MNNEGRNLEEINKKKILNFGDLSRGQNALGINVSGDEAGVKCERCNERTKAKGKDSCGNLDKEGKVYLKKAQVKKHDLGYYITGGIKFYCSRCDAGHNHQER